MEPMAGFALPSAPAIGNNLPAWTGSPAGPPDRPGPHPATQQIGGQTGDTDGFNGADPARPEMSPSPTSQQRLGHGPEQETDWRNGIIGWNDQLQLRDRHVYYKSGYQRFGWTPSVPGDPPNPHSDGPAMPYLHTINRSVNPQIGSDATKSQDDLSRPYTWLGQQDGTVVPVYGGVPGLWQSYGNRGLENGMHDPSNGEGGLASVSSGPPHGLHSDTIPDGKQLQDRYKATPQMKPVRQDRPSNSTIAGQSFSQTVVPQGGAPAAAAGAGQRGSGLHLGISGRGWLGG
jgi:hypothetical protein